MLAGGTASSCILPGVKPKRRVESALPIAMFVLAFAAAAVVTAATSLGIGVSPDSVAYLSAADAIASGRGVVTVAGDAWRPLSHFPPLFPLVAAIGPLFAVEATAWIRLLHAVLFAILTVAASLIVHRATGRSVLAAILGGSVLLASDDVVSAYCMAWSEPLFLVLLLAFIGALGQLLVRASMPMLVIASLLAAAATLTRYAGVSLVATGALAVLAFGVGPFPRRLRDATLFSLLAAGPIALWLARNVFLAGTATSRPLMLHPLPLHVYTGGAENVWSFLTQGLHVLDRIPRNLQAIGGATFLLAFVVVGLLARRTEDRLLQIMALFVSVHIATLAAAGAVQDYIVLDERHLLPVFVVGTLIVVAVLMAPWTAGRPLAQAAVICLVLLRIGVGAGPVASFLREARVAGLGYNNTTWKRSPLIARLRSLPAGVAIRSNADDAIYFLTGRMAAPLPMKYDPPSTLTNPRYVEELARVGRNGGVVAWFATVPWRRYAPSREELLAHPALREVTREADGSLFAPR